MPNPFQASSSSSSSKKRARYGRRLTNCDEIFWESIAWPPLIFYLKGERIYLEKRLGDIMHLEAVPMELMKSLKLPAALVFVLVE